MDLKSMNWPQNGVLQAISPSPLTSQPSRNLIESASTDVMGPFVQPAAADISIWETVGIPLFIGAGCVVWSLGLVVLSILFLRRWRGKFTPVHVFQTVIDMHNIKIPIPERNSTTPNTGYSDPNTNINTQFRDPYGKVFESNQREIAVDIDYAVGHR